MNNLKTELCPAGKSLARYWDYGHVPKLEATALAIPDLDNCILRVNVGKNFSLQMQNKRVPGLNVDGWNPVGSVSRWCCEILVFVVRTTE